MMGKKKRGSIHDVFFKDVLTDRRVALEVMDELVPSEIQAVWDRGTLERIPDKQVSKILGVTETDVLYKTQLQGSEGYLILHSEHQSSVDRRLPMRIWRYRAACWQLHEKSRQAEQPYPFIHSFVIYNGKRKYSGPLRFSDLFGRLSGLAEEHYGLKPIELIDVSQYSAGHWSDKPWMSFLMNGLKIWPSDGAERKKILGRIFKTLHDMWPENVAAIYDALFNYVGSQTDQEATEHMVRLVDQLPPEAIDMKKSYFEKLRDEALETGHHLGLEEGRQEGHQETLSDVVRQMLLEQVPIELIARYTKLSQEQILDLAEQWKTQH